MSLVPPSKAAELCAIREALQCILSYPQTRWLLLSLTVQFQIFAVAQVLMIIEYAVFLDELAYISLTVAVSGCSGSPSRWGGWK